MTILQRCIVYPIIAVQVFFMLLSAIVGVMVDRNAFAVFIIFSFALLLTVSVVDQLVAMNREMHSRLEGGDGT